MWEEESSGEENLEKGERERQMKEAVNNVHRREIRPGLEVRHVRLQAGDVYRVRGPAMVLEED